MGDTIMTCPQLLAAGFTWPARCLGDKCALWLPEINDTPAKPTGRGNCAHNPTAPARKPEE
jgi:hypothetical protein